MPNQEFWTSMTMMKHITMDHCQLFELRVPISTLLSVKPVYRVMMLVKFSHCQIVDFLSNTDPFAAGREFRERSIDYGIVVWVVLRERRPKVGRKTNDQQEEGGEAGHGEVMRNGSAGYCIEVG